MNKVGKEYISEIKTLFPIKTKKEKAYLKNLAIDVNGYCEEADVTSKQELYHNYGKPIDIVNSYFSSVDTEYIVKKIRMARYIKIALVIFLALALVATTAYCIYKYNIYQIEQRQEVVIVEEVLEEY